MNTLLDFNRRRFLPIKQWDLSDRPREKFLAGKMQEMPDEELLAILIGSGTASCSALDIARDITAHFNGNLMELSRRSPKELARKFEGVGEARAVSILAGMELGKRSFSLPSTDEIYIKSGETAFQVLCNDLSSSPYERFLMLLLAHSGKLIRKVTVSEGGIACTTVDAKKIFKFAIDEHACGIILAHNHPSGNLEPSPQDINITRKLAEGAKLLDLHIFDHLIIAGNAFYSFADHNLALDHLPFSPYNLLVK